MVDMVKETAKTIEFGEGSYMPLPSSLRIGDSDVHGQGLFAKEDIPQGTDLGLCHIFVMHDWDGKEWGSKYWERTPLGGFINHSDDPNIHVDVEGPRANFFTIKNITAGQELFCKYEKGTLERIGKDAG
jgi:hypothetical protein|tara:strand:+ start:485 stop:871 length:387 start_codon:yes stop_codon:yes gene_type:complete